MMSTRAPRVLSIQSHVVHGYVGNRCCVFPLQRLGFDVSFINSVQFSNHTGYPSFKGNALDGAQLTELLQGLEQNELAEYDYLVSGYIGSVSFLKEIVHVVESLRRHNPRLCYVCDPVLGDGGKLYVPDDLPAAYREEVVPLASVLTPNQFEAEKLVGFPLSSEAEALRACEVLMSQGPHTIVITSFEQKDDPHLSIIAATRQEQKPGGKQRLKITIPRLEGYFTGTGDLLTALLLAWLDKLPGDLAAAVEHALAGLQGVLQATATACGDVAKTTEHSAQVSKARELRLVQSQHLLEVPNVQLHAQAL